MKNLCKRFISAVLCFLMVLSVMPGTVFDMTAKADGETVVLEPVDDTWSGDATAYCSQIQGVEIEGASSNDFANLHFFGRNSGGDLSTQRYDSSMTYLKFVFSGYTDVKIKNATLKLYAKSNRDAVNNIKMFFYKMSNDWAEDTLTYFNAPLTPLSGTNIMVDVTGTNIEGRHQPLLVESGISIPASTADYKLITFDISDLLNKYNLIEDPTVSFAMLGYGGGYAMLAASKENPDESIHPVLEFETESIEPLDIVSATEGEIEYGEDVSVSFNNILDASTINSSTVTLYEDGEAVEISEEDIILSETQITVTTPKLPYCNYELVLSSDISDIYGCTLGEDKILEFSTVSTGGKMTLKNIFNSAHLDPINPDDTRITKGAWYLYANGNYYPYYVEMNASELIGVASGIEKVTYKVKYNSSNQYLTIYFYDISEDFDPEAVTYNTAPAFGNEFTAKFVGVNPANYVEIDLTDFVKEKLSTLSSEDPYIRFAMKSNAATTQIYGDLMSESNKPYLEVEYSDNSYLGLVSSVPENEASAVGVESDISLTFSSGIDVPVPENFVLKNIDTNEEITLSQDEISYDASSRTVTINPENDFSELCAYELIITGISSGDKVMKDKTVKFITSSRLEIGNITLEGAKPVTSGGKVSAKVTVTNNTSSPAKSPALILALYDTSASKEIKISGEGEEIQPGDEKEIEVSLNVDSSVEDTAALWAKAFLWNSEESQKPLKAFAEGSGAFDTSDSEGKFFGDITIDGVMENGENSQVSLRVCDLSGDTVYVNQNTADFKGKYSFVISLPESGDYVAYVTSDKNLEEKTEIEIKDYTSYQDYLDVWNNINSKNETKILSSIEDAVRLFEIKTDSGFDSVKENAAKEISGHEGFGKYTKGNIDSFRTYFEKLCSDLVKVDAILKSITDAKNYSSVSKILSDKANLKLLGLDSYYDEFSDNKTNVSKALVGKKFDDIEDFRKKFKSALDEDEEKPKKNSGGGGGGGKSGIVMGVDTPIVQETPNNKEENQEIIQTEENYFTDSALVPWAAKEIEFLYRMGVIDGKGYRQFAPNDNVLREEYVKLIMLATELYKDGSECAFNDVQKTDWFYPYVASAVENKVVSGISEAMFGTGSQITRQDLAVMTVRALAAMGYFTDATKESALTDMDLVSDYAKDAVKFLSENGIINGTPDGKFNPADYATRAETACIIFRTLEFARANASTIIKPGEPEAELGNYSFNTPTKAQIKADIEEKLKNKSHPYLHADREKLESIKQAVANKDDEYIIKQYALTKAEADSLLTASVVTPGTPIVSQSHISVRPRILTLMTVYYVEQDERYLKRALKEFENLQGITEWNSSAQLDNTMSAEAIATCYDWLYDYLSDDQKKWAEEMVKERCLDISYEYFKDPNTLSFLRSQHRNMNIVISRSSFNHAVYNNSNTIVAALAFAKNNPDYAATLISNALYNLEAYWELVKDGGFEEPSTYYHYCAGRAENAMSALYSSLGTLYDYEKSPGFKNTAWFGLYMYGPMTFGDCHPTKSSFDTNSLYFYAKMARNAQMMKRIIDLDQGTAVDPLLWYTKGEHRNLTDALSVPLDKLFSVPNQSTFVMRDQLDDSNNIFTGLYAGCANATGHSDAVSGLFCLDAYGERWITALGVGDYNLPGYFENGQNGQRWTYYERRAEAGSCLVINPSEDVGQDVTKSAVISKTEISDGCAFAIADLEPVYHREVTSYKRGLKLHNNRTQIVVQDEAVMKKPSKIFWSFNTPADVEIIDKNTAVMSIGSKKVEMKVWANVPFELYEMRAEALPTSPKAAGQKVFRQYRKIAISASDVTELKLMVEFTPYANDMQLSEEISEWVNLDNWVADEKETNKPLLDAIYVNGEKISDFKALNYFYKLDPDEYKDVPEITVDKNDDYNISVIYPEEFPGMIYIEVSDSNGDINYYSIDAREKEKPLDVSRFKKLEISKVSASDNDGNVPENAVDGNAATRWSASGEGAEPYLDIDLGSKENLGAIGISFYSGSSRASYFEILTSIDGKNWTKQIKNGESSGKTSDFENFSLGGVQARYIRYVGQQNSLNHWNSVTDIIVYGE